MHGELPPARALSATEIAEFVARMRATRTVPDASDEALVALATGASRQHFPRESVLFRAESEPDRVYLIASGVVHQLVASNEGSAHCVIEASAGYGIGEVPTLSGSVHLTTARAMSDDVVVDCMQLGAYQDFLSAHPASLQKILGVTRRRNFRVLVARSLARILRAAAPYEMAPLLDAFQPVSLARGEMLFEAGGVADGWYILVTGRLRITLRDDEQRVRTVAELGPGQAFGDLALLTSSPREVSAIAGRDSTVARVPSEIFLRWVNEYPELLRACYAALAHRAHSLARGAVGSARRSPKIYTVIRGSPGASVAECGRLLAEGLGKYGPTLHVDAATLVERRVLTDAAKPPIDHPAWLRAATWIEESASTFSHVVLEADVTEPAFEAHALRLADCVVAVANAGEGARRDLPLATASTELESGPHQFVVLVQPAGVSVPEGAERWGREAPSYRPLHVRRQRVADFHRVARTVSQRPVVLALGGGGARGFAHIGVIRACEELAIPIDAIGGTSMGSIIAAQYAMGLSPEQMISMNRRIATARPFSDFTVPTFSLLRTRKIERSARDAFGDRSIESLWLPYLAVSANLATADLVVHDRGLVWRATRASGALPGIALPAVEDRQVLIDGGVLNNLPGDILRERFGGTLIAVSVTPKEEARFAVRRFPSPWEALARWSARRLEAPTIVDIMMRAVTLTSARRARRVEDQADIFLALPVDEIGLLAFDRIDAAVEAGYRHAKAVLAAKRGSIP